MRWVRVSLKSNDKCPCETGREDIQTGRWGDNARQKSKSHSSKPRKECQHLQAVSGIGHFSLGASRSQHCQHFDLKPPARPLWMNVISMTWSHPVAWQCAMMAPGYSHSCQAGHALTYTSWRLSCHHMEEALKYCHCTIHKSTQLKLDLWLSTLFRNVNVSYLLSDSLPRLSQGSSGQFLKWLKFESCPSWWNTCYLY